MTGRSRLVRRQLLFLGVVGIAVSLCVSGRVTPRLVLDGALSAAFIPLIQVGAFAAWWRWRAPRSRSFVDDAASFTRGNIAWLCWWCAVAAIGAFVPPRALRPWLLVAVTSLPLPVLVDAVLDFRWLRAIGTRTVRAAVLDLVCLRGLAWTIGVLYFFGIAIWYGELPKIAAWWRQ